MDAGLLAQYVMNDIFGDQGNGQNTIALITKYVVQDGKWTVWEDSEYASGKRKLMMR